MDTRAIRDLAELAIDNPRLFGLSILVDAIMLLAFCMFHVQK